MLTSTNFGTHSDGILEEFLHGIINFDYSNTHDPVLYSTFDIELSFLSSKKSYVIQASDLVAGSIRHIFISNELCIAYTLTKFITFRIVLP